MRRCLAESPLTEEGTREVGETVFRALLDAAGPTGSIQVAFRIFPEHVEVDVLHSDTAIQSPVVPGPPVTLRAAGCTASRPGLCGSGQPASGGRRPAASAPPARRSRAGRPRRSQNGCRARCAVKGLTQEAAARQLGVSVKTVSRWVGGATEPRMRDLRRIQEVFGEVPLP